VKSASCLFTGLITLSILHTTLPVEGAALAKTRVSIAGGRWQLNDEITYPGAKAEGLLLNVRMVNATFEDQRRPQFDAEQNTDEFIARIPEYVAHGVRAFTLNPQSPVTRAVNPRSSPTVPCHRICAGAARHWACDRHGAVAALGCYQRQENLKDEQAVRAGGQCGDGCNRPRNVVWYRQQFGHGGLDHRLLG
jgi:hypothetical protein